MPDVTPFQTVGPFFEVLLRTRTPLPPAAAAGAHIIISGVLSDGNGRPIPDGLIETWQADAGGGYWWSATDDAGRFRIETARPKPVAGPDGQNQAPHLLIGVMARGILTRYVTRAYFDDEPANVLDPILAMVPAGRRHTLIATREGGRYRFDIRVQGTNETVFFDV